VTSHPVVLNQRHHEIGDAGVGNASRSACACHLVVRSFGGTSGGGLWRVYVHRREDGSFEGVHHRLIGIASSEVNGAPPRITCQGMGRIEMMLEGVRRRTSGKS